MSAAFSVITTKTGLLAALRDAQAGDVISLAGGDYGSLTLKGQAGYDMAFGGGVSIVSADLDDPAVFSGLDLRGASNMTFAGVRFDHTFAAGDRAWSRPFSIRDSENITITNSSFDGDRATGISVAEDGFASGIALGISDSRDITVSESTLTQFTRGIVTTNSSDIAITGNELSLMRSDGLNFSGVQGVQVTDNYIHDFHSSAAANDHADFIQFWTRGTTQASTDITIIGNRLDIGQGSLTQSIFMRNDQVDRGLAGADMFYRDITITDNVIVNAQTHGITVGETDGLVIANNTIIHADGGHVDGADKSVEIPRIHVSDAAMNVQITQNVTGGLAITDGLAGWVVADNAIVQDQDPLAANYYGDVFIASSLHSADGTYAYQIAPDSVPAQRGAGASASYGSSTDQGGTVLSAQFQVTTDPDNAAIRRFDASGATTGADVTYEWSFGDGTTATGQTVAHRYGDGGSYDVMLTVTNISGTSTSAMSVVTVTRPQILSLQDNGQFAAYDMGEATLVGDAAALVLGASGTSVSVDRAHVMDVLEADSFEIAVTLQATTTGAAGEVFRLHSSFLTQIDTAGEMRLYAWTKDGMQIKLTTSGAKLNDGASHDVAIRLLDGEMALIADGVAVTTEMTGTLADLGRHDLAFGNPWGKVNFAGTVTGFDITVNADDYVTSASGVLGAADSFEFVSGAGSTEPEIFMDPSAVQAETNGSPDTDWPDVSLALETLGYAADDFAF